MSKAPEADPGPGASRSGASAAPERDRRVDAPTPATRTESATKTVPPPPSTAGTVPPATGAASVLLVGDVMIAAPAALPVNATLGDVRRYLADPDPVVALLVDGRTFAGTIGRDELPRLVRDEIPARRYMCRNPPAITPSWPVSDAIVLLDQHRIQWLVVLDEEGDALLGLFREDPVARSARLAAGRRAPIPRPRRR